MEILFRGKPDIDQEWLEEMELTLDEYMENLVSANYKDGFVYGQVVYSGNRPYIVGEVVESTDEWITLEYWIPVKPETVGQYTGLEDKNGVKIFEGDIVVAFKEEDCEEANAVFYNANHCKWFLGSPYNNKLPMGLGEFCWLDLEVIGTHWDNPELLEVE